MTNMIQGWARNTYTTRGADPTVVVEWTKGGTKLVEFQNVYMMEVGAFKMADVAFVADLHKSLEALWQQQADTTLEYEDEGRGEDMSFESLFTQLDNARKMLTFHKRDLSKVEVYARGKRISKVELLDVDQMGVLAVSID